jgi:hypothetical protein
MGVFQEREAEGAFGARANEAFPAKTACIPYPGLSPIAGEHAHPLRELQRVHGRSPAAQRPEARSARSARGAHPERRWPAPHSAPAGSSLRESVASSLARNRRIARSLSSGVAGGRSRSVSRSDRMCSGSAHARSEAPRLAARDARGMATMRLALGDVGHEPPPPATRAGQHSSRYTLPSRLAPSIRAPGTGEVAQDEPARCG